MSKSSLLLSLSFILVSWALAQDVTQVVRGSVVDADSKYPLIGATVMIQVEDETYGSVTDVNGNFRIEEVPVGRHNVLAKYIGYQEKLISEVIVGSGKEVILDINLEESATKLEEVEITASNKGEPANEMALVSAREFSVEETDRYAGSRGDPARMASNFAGVQGADDSRNDIVIRGNSPNGVLWRFENLNIPNPNHFNIAGTAGGPVNIINNKYLGNSDFYTGAFPAEFGNSIAGVFDLRMRSGNNENYEFSGQLGFLGLELFGEGPFNPNNSEGGSFLAGYRYSTLSLFSSLGIDIGTTAVPQYQDAAFNVSFPTKNQGKFTLFGIGGTSTIDIVLSTQEFFERNIFGENNKDQYFTSAMGVVGANYVQPLNKRSYVDFSAGYSINGITVHHDVIFRRVDPETNRFRDVSVEPLQDYQFTEQRISGVGNYYYKADSRNTFSAGLNADVYFFYYLDSIRNVDTTSIDYGSWRVRWNSTDESALLLQPYVQWKHKLSNEFVFTAGLHGQYFSLSNSLSPVEPRVGMEWQFDPRQSITFGAGLHSQIQSPYLYFYGQETMGSQPVLENKDMDFTKSIHLVSGYQLALSKSTVLRSEAYFQHLYDVPVTVQPSSYSLINTGTGFSRFFPEDLVNDGLGRNYGVEVSVEQFFSNGLFFMVNGSLFESLYQGSDGIWRDTDFNGNYIYNGLLTKEFKLGTEKGFSLGLKATGAGGRRYGPADTIRSREQGELVYIDSERNTLQLEDYFRFDVRVNFFANSKNIRHEIAVDLINVFNIQNVLSLTYVDAAQGESPVRKEYQLGFLPIFYYRVDF